MTKAEAGRPVSLGTVTEGRLINPVSLPDPCPHCRILPRQAQRCLRYGTAELVGLLVRAAAVVEQHHPGSPRLALGNLSAARGGNIIWSRSHNSGRDADLSFYVTDTEDVPVDPPDLLFFDSRGWSLDSRGAWKLDLARTWTLLRALVEDRDAVVQFIFVYEPLAQRLLDHARRLREPEEAIRRVREVLLQPQGLPHNDHLHVRIHCPVASLQLGCREFGPRRDRAPDPAEIVAQRVREVLPKLRSPDREERFRATWLLGLLGAAETLPALVARLKDPEPAVRHRALRSLEALGGGSQAPAIVELLRREQDPGVLVEAATLLTRLGGKTAEQGLIRLLADRREFLVAELPDHSMGCTAPGRGTASLTPPMADPAQPTAGTAQPTAGTAQPAAGTAGEPDTPGALVTTLRTVGQWVNAATTTLLPPEKVILRRLAASALIGCRNPQIVPPLIDLLADPEPTVAQAAHLTLLHVTNRDEGRQPDPWTKWWKANRTRKWEQWQVTGFRQAGHAISDRPGKRDARSLIRALEGAPHLSYNARRLLTTIYGPPPPGHLDWSVDRARVYWQRKLK